MSAVAPARTGASPSVAKERATVHLEAREPVTVGAHRVTTYTGGELQRPDRFSPLCTTPCTTELPLGDHELALLRGDRAPIVAFPMFRISGPATLELQVTSRESDRTLGFWITVLSLSLGAATTVLGLIPTCDNDDSCARNASLAIWGGIGIITVGGTLGIPLWVRDDEFTVRVAPAPVEPLR